MYKKIECLIVSNSKDYSTDHIAYQLYEKKIPYLRINFDHFQNYEIELFPIEKILIITIENHKYLVEDSNLKSIYFRAPTFLRENNVELDPIELFKKAQWAAFLRSLIIFHSPLWVNHPSATYQAEIKPFQLSTAFSLGFDVPTTIVGNKFSKNGKLSKLNDIVYKTVDSAVIRKGNQIGFVYTGLTNSSSLLTADISNAPLIFQEALKGKIDIRITVINNYIYASSIEYLQSNDLIDWRLNSTACKYTNWILPDDIKVKCLKLVTSMNLIFAGIDLIYIDKKYYFIEINPTGEWAWLQKNLNLDIDTKIAETLMLKQK